MKKLSKIAEKIILIVVVIIGLFLLATLFPIEGNYQIKIVLSGSMEPAIKTGSVVIMKPESQYAVGDIITFGKDNRQNVPTTHRIVDSRAQDGVMLFTTKGDVNENNDTAEVRLSDIRGKVLFDIPYMGYIIDFVKKPVGMIIVIIIPAIYIIYDEMTKIVREMKKMRAKKMAENNPEENA